MHNIRSTYATQRITRTEEEKNFTTKDIQSTTGKVEHMTLP